MKSEKKIDQRVYSAEDIQVILGMKRSATYNYLTKVYKDGRPFLVHKVGSMYRIPKESFDAWLSGEK
ncbi:helix-turn-helix domain-containing protein [Clostridium sp.]